MMHSGGKEGYIGNMHPSRTGDNHQSGPVAPAIGGCISRWAALYPCGIGAHPALHGLIKDELVNMQVREGRKIYSITDKGKIAISLDPPLREHVRRFIGRKIPYKELYETFKLIIH